MIIGPVKEHAESQTVGLQHQSKSLITSAPEAETLTPAAEIDISSSQYNQGQHGRQLLHAHTLLTV